MNNLKFTLKAWPVITAVTIGLCFLTQVVAKLFGIELPDQANVEIVRKCLLSAFASPSHFAFAALLVVQVVVIMPVIEELVFRLPTRWLRHFAIAIVLSALFSAAHYFTQPWPDAAFVALFFFGLAQCWLYRRTRSIWCPMLQHALFNLTNLALALVF